MADIEARMRAFIEAGYRPQLKCHLLPGDPKEGWATLLWREWMRNAENEVVFLSEPRADSIGWEVDAQSVWPDRQMIWGAVAPTVEAALAYAERELERVTKMQAERG